MQYLPFIFDFVAETHVWSRTFGVGLIKLLHEPVERFSTVTCCVRVVPFPHQQEAHSRFFNERKEKALSLLVYDESSENVSVICYFKYR